MTSYKKHERLRFVPGIEAYCALC